MKSIPNFQSKDQADNLQSGVQNKAIGDLSSNPLNSGTHLTGISLKSGSNTISHKLGRKPQGFFPVSPDSPATVHQTASDKTTLTLTASADVNLSLYVF